MRKAICWLLGHRFGRFSYNRIQRVGTRRCRRCGVAEHKALPPLKEVL